MTTGMAPVMAGVNRWLVAASSAALAFTPVASAFDDEGAAMTIPVGYVGSGGVSSPQVILASFRWADSGGKVSVSLEVPMTAAEQLAYVRSVLGVSITDLAELLEVARPTVYAWMQGTEPRDEHLERIQRLERQARDIEAYGMAGLGRLLKRPLSGGQTLLGLIMSDQPVDGAMAELHAVARQEEWQRSVRKGAQTAATTADPVTEQSMPGYTTGA